MEQPAESSNPIESSPPQLVSISLIKHDESKFLRGLFALCIILLLDILEQNNKWGNKNKEEAGKIIIMTAKSYTPYYVPGTLFSALHILTDVVLKQPYEIGTTITPISQMRKLRHYLKSSRPENKNSNPRSVVEAPLLTTVLWYCYSISALCCTFSYHILCPVNPMPTIPHQKQFTRLARIFLFSESSFIHFFLYGVPFPKSHDSWDLLSIL